MHDITLAVHTQAVSNISNPLEIFNIL